jgi:hypothetical protein
LKSEVKNLEGRIGDDLAIPEFPALQASSKDIESRLAALAQVKIAPVIISEDGSCPRWWCSSVEQSRPDARPQ